MKIKELLIFFLISFFGFSQSKNTLPDGFTYAKELIPSINLELRYCTIKNFIGKPIIGYNAERFILSTKAAKALQNVQKELLSRGLSLKIYDAYRPQRAVNEFVFWASNLNDTLKKQEFYPRVKKKNLFKSGYIASKSGHSRGSTLDLTLVDAKTGIVLNMGSPYDFFGKESWVNYQDITKKQRDNRLLLKAVMNTYGFRSYSKEWWHFTLVNEPFPNTYFDFPVE